MSSTQIINGPSKFDLMQALFTRKPSRPSITLHLQESIMVNAFISSVEAEDGSGESWNIAGYVGNNKKFTAYYRTDKRTGSYSIAE